MTEVPPPFHHERLWLKAKLFINRSMEDKQTRGFDERALWASLGLELLAKAALSKTSPVLVAEPTADGRHLLAATGLIAPTNTLVTVRAKTLFARCAVAFRPFDAALSTTISDARNNYLHDGSPRFAPIPEDPWWQQYWSQAAILVNALDQTLEDLVGLRRVAEVEAYLEKRQSNIDDRVEERIERARQLIAQDAAGTLTASASEAWARRRHHLPLYLGKESEEPVGCPACGSLSKTWLSGEYVESTDVQYERLSEDEFEAVVTLNVSADYFACAACGLELDRPELVAAAGLPETFGAEGSIDDVWEQEYGND